MPAGQPVKDATLINFLKKIDTSSGCWIWTAKSLRNGYPALDAETWGHCFARQWIYQMNGGELKSDTILYNTCFNKLCCNAEHLTYDNPECLLTKFMEMTDTNGPVNKAHLGQCWLWLGACGPAFAEWPKGHGYINKAKWGETLAHRWIFKNTYPTTDISVFTINHECDVPFCVNPAHLKKDTQKSNMSQMAEQGRAHNQVIKSSEEAKSIRQKILDGARTKDLCEQLKCSKVCIADLKLGRSWKHASAFPAGWPPKA